MNEMEHNVTGAKRTTCPISRGYSGTLPRLKFVNRFVLVVMGVELPITAEQARNIYGQLQQMQGVSHG